MGGNGSLDSAVSKKTDTNEPNNPKESNNSKNTEQNHIAANGAAVSPHTWLNEMATGKTGSKTAAAKVEEQKPKPSLTEIAGILPVLEAVTFMAPRRPAIDMKFYGIPVDLNTEIQHRIPNAPKQVQDYYKELRQSQMQHRPPNLTSQQRGELAGWTLFGEEKTVDPADEIGRQKTQEYVQRVQDRITNGQIASAADKTKDNELLATIHSLLLNNHDHMHNPDEITTRNGMYHLPEKFTRTVIDDKGQAVQKEYKVRELAEKHMFAILQGTAKSPLTADEYAVYALHSQVARQVLPLEILDAAHDQERENIVTQYTVLIANRNQPFPLVSQADFNSARKLAKLNYPDIPDSLRGRDLSDAENIFRQLTVTEIQQIRIEELERMAVMQRPGVPARFLPKSAEPPLPDFLRKAAYTKLPIPRIEWREGQTLKERDLALTIFESSMKLHIQRDAKEKSHLAAWTSSPNNWRIPYLITNKDANATEITALRDANLRFSLADQCDYLSKATDLYTRYQDDKLTGPEEKELLRLDSLYEKPANQQPCKHYVKRQRQERIR